MLYFGKTHVSEGIDVDKTSASKECIICHFHYFLDKRLKFQQNVWIGCHDILMMFIHLNDIVILIICSDD